MLELKKPRNFQDGGTSKCASFGSDNLPCSQSQSRKISIGVMVNEPLKGYKTRKEEKVAPTGGKFVEVNNNGAVVTNTASQKGKQADVTKKGNSPWVSTKSFHQETPITNSVQFHQRRTFALRSSDGIQKNPNSTCDQPIQQTVHVVANQTSILQFGEDVQNQSNSKSEAPVTKTVQFYTNRMSVLQSTDGGQKKFDSITYGRKEKGGRTERVEEFAFTAAKEVRVLDKGAEVEGEKTAPRSNGSLKTKLWEILGTAPEEENELNSQTLEDGVKNSNLGGNLDQKNRNAPKLRQNSDTMEADSESPQETIKRPESPLETMKRPVTRSLTQKKTSSLANPKLLSKISNGGKLPSFSNHRQKSEEKSIFTFCEAEGWLSGLHGTVSGGTSSKKRGRKSTIVEPQRISFSGKADPEKSRRAIGKSKRPPRKKAASHSNTTESFHSHSTQTIKESPQPAREKVDRQENLKTPNLCEEENHHDNVDNISSKKNTQENDASSPGLGVKTPTENCSLSPPSAKTNKMQPVGRRFTSEGFCKLRSSQIFRTGFSCSDAETKSPDPTGELQKSPIKEQSPFKEQDVEQNLSQSSKEQEVEYAEEEQSQPSKEQDVEDAEERLSQSSKEQDAESLEKDTPIIKVPQITKAWAPESGSSDKPKFMLRPRKRLCSPVSEFDPTPLSPEGTEESNSLQEPSYQDDEDGLASAVSLFAFALEKFKTRMKAETSKRSSLILASVTEGIKLQLQDINSQIQNDIGKFTGISKSKRKRLETRFLEQQMRLKLIQDKFKEEINQHLQDCKNTLDDLEGYQIELKGNAEKLNASHRKLLLQVEGAIETQLSDAERRITSIQQVANGNMLQLKRMIAECLKDGVFS